MELPLTAENVESVLDEIRPYLIADGGNVALHEIDGNVVRLKLQGACGSCPSSVTTMKMGIERRLMEKIPEIVAVEPIADEETGLELNEENIEKVSSVFYEDYIYTSLVLLDYSYFKWFLCCLLRKLEEYFIFSNGYTQVQVCSYSKGLARETVHRRGYEYANSDWVGPNWTKKIPQGG